MTERRGKAVDALLLFLVALDATIATGAIAFPKTWFLAFHGAPYVDPQALLPRTGASWAAWAVIQLVALLRWRREPHWLAIVAGIRLGDALTDWTYLLLCESATWFARASLSTTSPGNVLIGLYLLSTYARIQRERAP